MALPTAILLSGVQSPQLLEISDQINVLPSKLLQGLQELKKEKETRVNILLSHPYLKIISSMDSGIGTSDSDYSRTPSPSQINEFEFKTKIIIEDDKRVDNFTENVLETVPEENGIVVQLDGKLLMQDDINKEVVESRSAPEDAVPAILFDNMSEASSEYSSEATADSVDWLIAISNSADKLKYYMEVIDRLENKFTMFAQSNCPEGHIYSSLDPRIMHEKRDILDLASNMKGNNFNFQQTDEEIDSKLTDVADLPPHHIKKCKIDDCSYNEHIYD